MPWLVEVIVAGCVFVMFTWAAKALLRRYQRCTLRDSNAPDGFVTDWDLFWGRRR